MRPACVSVRNRSHVRRFLCLLLDLMVALRRYKFIECSARENINVGAAFEAIAHEIVDQWRLGNEEEGGAANDSGGLDVGRQDAAEPKKKCC